MRDHIDSKVEQIMLQGVCDCDDISEVLEEDEETVKEAQERVFERWLERIERRDILAAGVAAKLQFLERRLWALFGEVEKPTERLGLLKSILSVIGQFVTLLGLRKAVDEDVLAEEKAFIEGAERILREIEEEEQAEKKEEET